MSAMVIIQFIYLKLGKKGPNTQMCFYTNSYHRERYVDRDTSQFIP